VIMVRYAEAAGRWVLFATVLGSGLTFLDATVVNIALPRIGEDFDAGAAALQWTVNGYTLSLAALILLGGSLGDRFGRRRLFVIGTAWFAAASLLCGLAPNVETLIAARVLQGVGGALLTPGSLAILEASFESDDRAKAIGAWSGMAGVAGAVGPFLGGWLIEAASWRLVFLINVPLAALVIYVALRHVPESSNPATGPADARSARVGGDGRRLPASSPRSWARTSPAFAAARSFDIAGLVTGAAGLAGLTYGFTAWAAEGPGSPAVLAALAIGVGGLAAFLVVERRSSQPMLPLELFRIRPFTAANLVTFAVYAALGGVFFLVVLNLQVVAGFGPLAAGTALLPVTALMLVLSARAGALGQRIGPRIPMTAGPLACAGALVLLSRAGAGTSYLTDVLPAAILLGLGLSLTVAPLTATALGSVPEEHAGIASGVNNAVARAAGLLAVAILPLAAGIGTGSLTDAGDLAPVYRNAMLICAVLLVAGAAAAAAWVPSRVRRESEVPAHCGVTGPAPRLRRDQSPR
jgi:MFS family permease